MLTNLEKRKYLHKKYDVTYEDIVRLELLFDTNYAHIETALANRDLTGNVHSVDVHNTLLKIETIISRYNELDIVVLAKVHSELVYLLNRVLVQKQK